MASVSPWLNLVLFAWLFCNFARHTISGPPPIVPHPKVLYHEVLMKDLLANYSKNGFPSNGILFVHCDMNLYQILSVDDRQQIITVSGGFLMKWEDTRLRWNPSEYGNVSLMSIPTNLLWRPDVGLSSGTEKSFDFSSILDTRAQVSNWGFVAWHVVHVFKSSCSLDMTDFPFDSQNCILEFGSQTILNSQMRLLASPKVSTTFYKNSDEWKLVSVTPYNKTKSLPQSITEGNPLLSELGLSVVEVHLELNRRTGYYWVHLITPCMLISGLVTTVFIMPADSGEKVSFAITILLAFTVYQLLVAETLPKASETTPLLSNYLAGLIGLSALSVVLSLLVLNVHHTDPSIKMPRWFRTMIFGFLAYITCNCSKPKILQRGKISSEQDEKVPVNLYDELKCSLPDVRSSKATDPSHGELMAIRELLGAIYRQNLVNGEDINQWKLAASVLDRFFFICYALFTVAFTVGLMTSVKKS